MTVATRHRDSPRVRRLAREANVDLSRLAPTGRHGRATAADVAEAARRATPGPTRDAAVPLTTVVEIDVTRVAQASSPTALVARAALDALADHPRLNAGADRAVHLGIAVDTGAGVVVPVVRDAGDLSVEGLSRRVADTVARARAGSLTEHDTGGATFTLTDAGDRGMLFQTPLLPPGQAAALCTGAVVERPTVVRLPDGERRIGIRSMVHVALTHDSRLVDGADAARFLATMRTRLEAGDDAAAPASAPTGRTLSRVPR
jgi:2-oxoglutarate dehydrogenase E2 component (dihydrolipoamide succinyltransferase)